jgi:holo-[acyl-carrier protein] synthase
MIIGTGIDLVQISRIQTILTQWGDRFMSRVFTPNEIAYCLNRKKGYLSFAARFAAKEAVLKALGVGLQMGVCWREIETTHDSMGKPIIRLSGKTDEIAQRLLVSHIFVSLTHDGDYAMAMATATATKGHRKEESSR